MILKSSSIVDKVMMESEDALVNATEFALSYYSPESSYVALTLN
ncbi:hypothetical protein [Leptospira noguchii]|nr:hypothetical protein [Leptospira noguchii]